MGDLAHNDGAPPKPPRPSGGRGRPSSVADSPTGGHATFAAFPALTASPVSVSSSRFSASRRHSLHTPATAVLPSSASPSVHPSSANSSSANSSSANSSSATQEQSMGQKPPTTPAHGIRRSSAVSATPTSTLRSSLRKSSLSTPLTPVPDVFDDSSASTTPSTTPSTPTVAPVGGLSSSSTTPTTTPTRAKRTLPSFFPSAAALDAHTSTDSSIDVTECSDDSLIVSPVLSPHASDATKARRASFLASEPISTRVLPTPSPAAATLRKTASQDRPSVNLREPESVSMSSSTAFNPVAAFFDKDHVDHSASKQFALLVQHNELLQVSVDPLSEPAVFTNLHESQLSQATLGVVFVLKASPTETHAVNVFVDQLSSERDSSDTDLDLQIGDQIVELEGSRLVDVSPLHARATLINLDTSGSSSIRSIIARSRKSQPGSPVAETSSLASLKEENALLRLKSVALKDCEERLASALSDLFDAKEEIASLREQLQRQQQQHEQQQQQRQPRQPVDLRASKPLSPPPHPATADANSESVSPMTSSAHSTTSRDFASPPSVQASPLSFRNPEAPAPIRPPPLLHSASVPVLKAADRATEPTETANPAVSRIKAEADSAATSTPPSPRRGSDLAPPPLPTAEEEEHSALKRPALVHRHSLEYRVRALTFLTLPSNFPSPVCWTGVFVSFLPAGLLLLQSRNRDDPNAPSSPRRPSSVLEVRSDSVIPGLDVEDPRPKQIENIVHSAENLLPQIDAFLIEAKTLLFPIDGMRRNQRYLKELLVRKIKKLSEIDTADSDPLCVLAYSALQRIQAIQKKLDIPL
eukprot:m.504494 g.504494  ORF g.504494 m.504494 type:complete len:814 (+) comp57355_c0_seq2:40-2481(+)